MMAAELQTSREKLEQSRQDLERKNVEVDARRRYIETILERVATGVISLDAGGQHLDGQRRGRAAARARTPTAIGQPARDVLAREDLRPLLPLVDAIGAARRARASCRRSRSRATDREIHLAAAATVLTGDGRQCRRRGARARRRHAADSRAAGRGLARRRAAPRARNQEPADADSAQRRAAAPALRRRAAADAGARRRVHGRDHHRSRSAEGPGRRVRAVRAAARPAHGAGRSQPAGRRHAAALRRRAAAGRRCTSSGSWRRGLPPVRLDAEQIRQVIINLVDNAMEALGGPDARRRGRTASRPLIVVLTIARSRATAWCGWS